MQTVNTHLKFIEFTQLTSWSTYALLRKNLIYTQNFDFIKIGQFLKRNKEQVTIENKVKYRRPKIKINAQGVFIRDEVFGESIGTKKQFRIHEGQFLLSKIDARNGAFGVVPKKLGDGIITGNFWTFDVSYEKINPKYLTLLTGTKEFQILCQSASVGTTNRNYLQEDLFLNFNIPLPTLPEQKQIVKRYYDKINKAEQLKHQAGDLEGEIEKYFLEQLGLKSFDPKEKSNTLQIIDYTLLDRWDVFATDVRIAKQLKNSKYELASLGSKFHFTNRTFNKRQYEKDTFQYIEIGGIDPNKGIVKSKEVSIKKAPSRATQHVKEGDLIIGTTRPYLRKFTIVPKEYDNDVCSSGFSIIESSKEYHLPFLLQFLKCTYGIEQLKNRMTGGLYPAITESELREIKVPFPEVSQQKEIMGFIEEKRMDILDNEALITSLKEEAEQEFEKTIFNS